MIVQVNIIDFVTALNEKYKDRYEYNYERKIDKIINKLDIINNYKTLIFYLRTTTLECYLSSRVEIISTILKEAEFLDETKLYFVYKIILEIKELINSSLITISINIYKSKDEYIYFKNKKYFEELLNISKNIDLTRTEQFKKLDELIKYDILNVSAHGNTKYKNANLLGYTQYKPFRPNLKKELNYKIKTIKKDQKRGIICPVCGYSKDLFWNNKDELFKSSSKKITFICDHINSDYYDTRPVEINLKEYKKMLKGIDEVDWVIYNYPILFKQFADQFNKDNSDNYVI